MGTKKPFVYQGTKYESLAQFMRLNGLENKDPVTVKNSFNFNYVPLFSDGDQDFYSMKEICNHYKINYHTMRNAYFRIGLSLDEIIKRHKKGLIMRANPVFDHLGNEYNTKSEMCQKWNVDLKLFLRRIKIGYTIEQALTATKYDRIKPIRKRKKKNDRSSK